MVDFPFLYFLHELFNLYIVSTWAKPMLLETFSLLAVRSLSLSLSRLYLTLIDVEVTHTHVHRHRTHFNAYALWTHWLSGSHGKWTIDSIGAQHDNMKFVIKTRRNTKKRKTKSNENSQSFNQTETDMMPKRMENSNLICQTNGFKLPINVLYMFFVTFWIWSDMKYAQLYVWKTQNIQLSVHRPIQYRT